MPELTELVESIGKIGHFSPEFSRIIMHPVDFAVRELPVRTEKRKIGVDPIPRKWRFFSYILPY